MDIIKQVEERGRIATNTKVIYTFVFVTKKITKTAVFEVADLRHPQNSTFWGNTGK